MLIFKVSFSIVQISADFPTHRTGKRFILISCQVRLCQLFNVSIDNHSWQNIHSVFVKHSDNRYTKHFFKDFIYLMWWYLELCLDKAWKVLKWLPQGWHAYPDSEGKCLLSRCALALYESLLVFPQIVQRQDLSGFLVMYFVANSSIFPASNNPIKNQEHYYLSRWYFELCLEKAWKVLKCMLHDWHSYPESVGKCLLSKCFFAS